METVFLKLLNISITAGWLVLAVVLLRLAMKKAPRWIFCLLWAIVGIRLAIPISIESALSLIPSAEVIPETILYESAPAVDSGIAAVDRAVNPIIAGSFAPEPAYSVNPLQILTYIAGWVWLIGFGAMLVYAGVSFLVLKSRMRTATLLEGNVRQSDRTDSPFVLGLLRPIIYLPYSVSENDMAFVLAHERAHIVRRDHWWKPLGFVLLAVYWFNPFMWVAYVLLCRDIEAACDEKVVADMEKEDRRAYSTALLNCSVRRRSIAACPLAFGEVGVKNRIKGVMSYKRPAVWIIVTAVLICVATAVCFLTDPKDTDDDLQPTQSELPGAEERLLEIFRERVPQGTATDWVVAEDGAWDLLGVVLYTDADGDPCWLSFVDEQEVCQTVGFSGEGELAVAEDSELTYLGDGGVSLRLVKTRTGKTIEYRMNFSRTDEKTVHLQAGSFEQEETEGSGTDFFDPAQYGITEAQLKAVELPDFPDLSLPALVSYYLHTDGAGAEGAASELYRRFMKGPGEIIQYLGIYGSRSYERNGETVNQSVNTVVCDAIANAAVFWYDSADELRVRMSGCPVGEGSGVQLAMEELRSALKAAEMRQADMEVRYTDWTLDGPYTERNNVGLSLREQFGTALGENPNYIILGDDGTIRFAFGVFFGSGVYEPDGDTGRIAAHVVIYPEEWERTLTLYEYRESPDSATYLVMEYGDHQLYWKEN